MFCTKCGSEIDNNEKFCNKCGNKKSQFKFGKKKIIIVITLLLLSVIGFLGFKSYQEKSKVETISLISNNISTSAEECRVMINEISTVWNNAIDYGEDFNDALDKLMNQRWSISEKLEKREIEKSVIQEDIKKMKKGTNTEIYSILTEYYVAYEKIYNAATNPSGSLLSYNAERSKLFADLTEKQTRLEMYLDGK